MDREVHGRLDCTCGITVFLSVHCHLYGLLAGFVEPRQSWICHAQAELVSFPRISHTNLKVTATHSRGEAARAATASQSADRCWLGRPVTVTSTSCRPAATPARMLCSVCCSRTTDRWHPCCLVPVGRRDNALSSVRLRLYIVDSDSAVITDVRVQLAKVDLMERVKICFTIIPQHQDRCLSGTVADWDGGADERSEP